MNTNPIKYKDLKKPLPLDGDFIPAVAWNKSFSTHVMCSKHVSLKIAIEKNDNSVLVQEKQIFPDEANLDSLNYFYIEQLIKRLLWIYGGYKITIGGSKKIAEYIKRIYAKNGKRYFDSKFMSDIYERPFSVEFTDIGEVPSTKGRSLSLGRHLEGCRIGFDLGASDRKVSAVIDGRVVFSEEVLWSPGTQPDESYHYDEIIKMIDSASRHMTRIDAIGGSAAGIYINNLVKKSSLFRGIPPDIFKEKVKNIFINIQKKYGVPLTVINDGEVTALAGSMSLKANAVLGIAMGSSEAGGYINNRGRINPWLNELAFIPIDFNPGAPFDEWSGDRGCGVQYLSQTAVVRLAEKAGINIDSNLSLACKLEFVQNLAEKGDPRAVKIFKTIGGYLAYGIACYADFYDIRNVLILGRVTSGTGGQIIIEKAKTIFKNEFPELFDQIKIHLPDERNRRVGQSIAAASLPLLKNRSGIM